VLKFSSSRKRFIYFSYLKQEDGHVEMELNKNNTTVPPLQSHLYPEFFNKLLLKRRHRRKGVAATVKNR